jgi:hypothetical protein
VVHGTAADIADRLAAADVAGPVLVLLGQVFAARPAAAVDSQVLATA